MSLLSDAARRADLASDASATGLDLGDAPGRPPRRTAIVTTALVVVVASCVALLVGMSLAGRATADGGLDLPAERDQVMSLTDQFVKRLGTYSPDMIDDSGQMPAYRDQVREVITPKFAADFDKEVAAAEQLVAQGSITRTADVFATAVSSIDDDSARVLVAGAFTDSYEQGTGDGKGEKATTIDQEPLPFRFIVDLVMIGGEWLVDDFSPVSSPDETTGSEGSNP